MTTTTCARRFRADVATMLTIVIRRLVAFRAGTGCTFWITKVVITFNGVRRRTGLMAIRTTGIVTRHLRGRRVFTEVIDCTCKRRRAGMTDAAL